MMRIAICSFLLLMTYASICNAQNKYGPAEIRKTSNAAPSIQEDSAQSGESWTELDAVKSGLKPSRIAWAILGKSDSPEYTDELVRVQWRPGDPIELHIVRPHGVTKPPVILYLYSYPADGTRFTQKAWCSSVTKNGFAAVGFVAALTGQRYHSRPMKEWFVSELQEALGTSTHDVQMILDYLASRGDLDATKIGMLGEGSGGAIAILAATADPRIAFVDAINPWGDWPDWLKESRVVPEAERSNYLKPEFLEKVTTLDPVKYLPQLSPGRIRIEQVAGDPMTPSSVQAEIAASAPSPGSVVQYPDLHAQIQAWMTQNWWLKERLRPASAQSTTAQVSRDGKPSEP